MPSFVLELEVSYSKKLLNQYKPGKSPLVPGQKSTLEKKMNVGVAIRNTAKGEALRRLHILQHDRQFQQVQEEYAKRKRENPEADTSDLSAIYQSCMERAGYSEYALHSYIVQAKHQYHDILGADECQKLATQAFQAVEKVRKGESRKVTFLPRTSDTSVEGKSEKSTLKYAGDCCIQFGKGNLYPLIIKKNDVYAQEALKRKVKYVRLVRRTIRGKQRYFAQLVMDGIPPKTKNLRYGRKNSRVGLDLGTSTVAVCSKKEVSLNELAPGTAVDEKELRRLNRAIDRSKRATNPDNYKEDGTVRKGRLTWKKSNRCRKLEQRRKELYRRSAWKRRCEHHRLANHLLSLGLDIRVEQMRISALAKRSSKTTVNQKNGRIHSKKRYGKTVMSRAPAMLIQVLEQKLSYLDLEVKKINTSQVKASQYDHKADTYKRKQLSERWHVFEDGTSVQRDLYSAFLICYTTDTLDGIDRKVCLRNYQQFKQLQDEEILRIRNQNGTTMRWYVA